MTDILVLGYHAVSSHWRSDLAVTPVALEAQLRVLVERGYKGATFSAAVSEPPSSRTVVVTFDDAYRSVLDLAAPVLAELSMPATVFVPTLYVDSRASWTGVDIYLDGPDAHELDVMSWSELGGLSESGWEVGSHTRSHPWLVETTDDRLCEELVRSREDCERELGLACSSLAYPYGSTDSRVMAAAKRAGYVAAAGLPRARALHSPHTMNWPRVGVFVNDGLQRFKLKVSPTGRRLRTSLSHASSTPPAHRGAHERSFQDD